MLALHADFVAYSLVECIKTEYFYVPTLLYLLR